MKITVFNVKGGAGKTPIAVNIVLEKEWAIATNEPYHILDTFIEDDRILAIRTEESFPYIPDEIDIVFDLAGTISEYATSVKSAINQSDLVIVPIFNELKCLAAGIYTIQEISNITKKIMVVGTKLQKKKGEVFSDWNECSDFRNIKRIVDSTIKFPIVSFPLKFSTAFERIFEDEKSINKLMENNPLLARSFRDVAKQFNDIFYHIERSENAAQKHFNIDQK